MKHYLLASAMLLASPALAAKPPVTAVIDTVVKENAGTASVPVVRSGDLSRQSCYTYATQDSTAIAGINYTAASGTSCFAAGQSASAISIPVHDDGKITGNLTFRLNITVDRGSHLNGLVTLQNVDVAPAPLPTPTPTPTPTPIPVPAGWVASPTLDGLPPITSPFDYKLALQPSWGTGAIPASAAPDVVGAFRFIMRDAGVNSDDAIVFPGQPGKSHLHQYYGRKGWNANSTYENMRLSAGSVGNDFNGALAGNGSGYWTPAMLDANGNVAKLAFVSGYYKRRPASDPKCGGLGTVFGAEGKCVGVPNGLRLIAGYDMLTGKAPTGQAWFNCQGPTAVPGHYANLTEALANCPTNSTNLVGFVIELPDCWDGKNLDSPNHRDHVSYQQRDVNSGQMSCDAAHPYVIPKLTLGAWFTAVPGMHFSCDPMLPAGTPPGTCGHADYFENWDPTIKAMWQANCIDGFKNASGGDLCNGFQLKEAQ